MLRNAPHRFRSVEEGTVGSVLAKGWGIIAPQVNPTILHLRVVVLSSREVAEGRVEPARSGYLLVAVGASVPLADLIRDWKRRSAIH